MAKKSNSHFDSFKGLSHGTHAVSLKNENTIVVKSIGSNPISPTSAQLAFMVDNNLQLQRISETEFHVIYPASVAKEEKQKKEKSKTKK